MNRIVLRWWLVGLAGYLLLPWYAIEGGFWDLGWLLDGYPLDADYAPGLAQVFVDGRAWLAPIAVFLLLPLGMWGREKHDPLYSAFLIAAGVGGMAWVLFQGFAIGIGGWEYAVLEQLFGPTDRQFGMGYGALLVMLAFLFFFTEGIAARGFIQGDSFFVGSIGLIVALVSAFILFPVSQALISALQDNDGNYSLLLFFDKLFSEKNWGVRCLQESVNCGVAWNSLVLAIAVGLTTTVFGLAFALVATRTRMKGNGVLRALTVLPIITPPFVIGLAIILLFGRSGAVTQLLESPWASRPAAGSMASGASGWRRCWPSPPSRFWC